MTKENDISDLNEWILQQCGGKLRARGGYIRSLLNMVRHGVLLLGSHKSGIVTVTSRKDKWLPVEQLRKRKKIGSIVPIYPVGVMGDLMSELKEKLGISKATIELKETVTTMRIEQPKITKALVDPLSAPDPL